MAIGFTPKHLEELPLTNYSANQYLELALKAAESIEWQVFYVSSIGFKAYAKTKGVFGSSELVKFKIIDDLIKIESTSTGTELIDLGRNAKHIARLLDKIQELKSTYTADELEQHFSGRALVPDEEDDLQMPIATKSQRFKDFLSVFVPKQGYFITPVILNINLLVFIAMVATGINFFEPDNESLIKWGANFRPETLAQPGRLITNFFLHIGILHLLFNMYALVYIGLFLEPVLGKIRFIAAYFVTGIAASLTSLWWHDYTISAGASGAIFGMHGVFLALLATNLIYKTARKELLTSVGLFIGYNVYFGISHDVDNAAHIGGLISGIIVGLAMVPSIKSEKSLGIKLGTVAGLVFLTLFSSFVLFRKTPNDIADYEQRMQVFSTNESQALEILRTSQNIDKEQALSEIKDRGIYYWRENLQLVKDVDTLTLPQVIHDRNKLLTEYCNLRIKSYELMYKSLERGQMKEPSAELQAAVKDVETIITKIRGF